MAVGTPRPSQDPYGVLFQGYVRHNARYVLEQVRRVSGALADEIREQALHTLSYALKLADAWRPARDLLLELAPKMEQAGYREDWLAFLRRGLAASREREDGAAEAEILLQIGILYQRQGQLDAAREAYSASCSYFERVGDHARQARAINRLADVARLERRFEEAAQLVEQARALAADNEREAAYSSLILGAAAFERRDWRRAKELFEQSLSLWKQLDDQRMIAWSETNLGVASWGLERYDEAIGHYERAIALFERVQDPLHMAVARKNLGNIYLTTGDLEEALRQYHLAEPYFRRMHDQFRLAALETNKGMAYQKQGLLDKAETVYRRNVAQWRALGHTRWLVNAMDNLGETYLELGRFSEAQSVFQAALEELERIAGDPEYEDLRLLLLDHLQAATDAVAR